ncbi:MAG: class IV adenylate cyclase, partial [Candidatus Altarchaeaceae archaeon]
RELGFRNVAKIEKHRIYYSYKNFEICIDDVKNLGKFVEIESNNLNDKDEIFKLLEIFDIRKDETIRKSYLELIMNK